MPRQNEISRNFIYLQFVNKVVATAAETLQPRRSNDRKRGAQAKAVSEISDADRKDVMQSLVRSLHCCTNTGTTLSGTRSRHQPTSSSVNAEHLLIIVNSCCELRVRALH